MAGALEEHHTIEIKPSKQDLELQLKGAVIDGDLEKAKKLFKEHPGEITTSTWLDIFGSTALHLATVLDKTEFVDYLVEMMNPEDLDLKNWLGETAFCYAVHQGLIECAMIMLNKRPDLATAVTSYRDFTGYMNFNCLPIEIAAIFQQSRMVSCLYEVMKNQMEEIDRHDLLLTLIQNDVYDIAKEMLSDYPELATQVNCLGESALYKIAGKVSITRDMFPKQTTGLAKDLERNGLMKELLKHANGQDDLIKKALFRAARENNYGFLAEAICVYPGLATELDENNHTIFHVGVQHRHLNVFKMIHTTAYDKSSILLRRTDRKGNDILHLAAKLPLTGLEVVPGAGLESVLQLQRELLFFEEVKNDFGMQRVEPEIQKHYMRLFGKEHEALRSKGEKWLTNIASVNMSASALVLSAGIAVIFIEPGSYKQDSGSGVPIHLIGISYAATLLFPAVAIFFFLSILTSSFSTRNIVKSLPYKLLFGLSAFFLSVVALMVAFSAAFFVHFENPSPRLCYSIASVAFLLIVLASYLQLPLLFRIFHSAIMPLHSRRDGFCFWKLGMYKYD